MTASLFPHDKLDWSLRALEQRVVAAQEDAATRLEYAGACLSKARYHGGGEAWFNRALTEARRVIQSDPGSVTSLCIAGIALVGLERYEPAARYLDQALRTAPERAEVHLGLGALHEGRGDHYEAVREMEVACRLRPDAWEVHAGLGRLLADRAEELEDEGRVLERAQYHMVRAIQLGASASELPDLLHELGVSCLRTERLAAAQKVFTRLADSPRHRASTRYHLGIVAYQLGKYKNAILYLRQYLEVRPDNHRVHTRIGMAYLHLGEATKAREACHRALAMEPGDLQARWTLGCALLEEGNADEATRILRDILQDAPEHGPAFQELVRLRVKAGDGRWLLKALRAEVTGYDRLPERGARPAIGRRPIPTRPRRAVRARIDTLLRALHQLRPSPVDEVLHAMDLTTDEALRFVLWDGALDLLAADKARQMARRLEHADTQYGAASGREALVVASSLPEPLITSGLQITEEHLRRAAVDRNGPVRDVAVHRANIDRERQGARAWQALLLLALGTRETQQSHNLLVRWASDADPDLADAARAALAMSGDADALGRLRQRASTRGAEHLVDQLVASSQQPNGGVQPRPVSDDESLHCSTCGRRNADVTHMLANAASTRGTTHTLCDRCATDIAMQRRELATDDPRVVCSLCGKNNVMSRAVYVLRGTPICASCVDISLGLLEREEVDRFLASW